MKSRMMRLLAALSSLVLFMSVAGCTSSRLHRNTFEGRTIAVMAAIPPAPLVQHELLFASHIAPYFPGGRQAEGFALAEQRQAERIQAILNEAVKQVDVSSIIARRTLIAGAEALGTTIIDSPTSADYVLDLRVYDFGLTMRSSGSPVHVIFDAEALLREGQEGAILWRERINTSSYRTGTTGTRMTRYSDEQMEALLEEFAAYISEQMTKSLQKAVRE